MKKYFLPFLIIAVSLFSSKISAQTESDTTLLGLPGDNLNLYAVLDLFQKSKTIEDFEKELNLEKTGINNLRYYETAFDKFSYIFQRQVKDTSDQTLAYIYMLSNPRRYRSEAMIPELFKQSEEFSFERSPLYAYGLYNQSELVSNFNDYPFPSVLTPDETNFNEYKFVEVDGYSELWYKQSAERMVLITRKSNMLLEAITLFAYLFCAFLFLVAIFQLASVIVKSGFRWSTFREMWQLSIRNQIFMTIIFISIFSFVIIGAATIIFFINRYNRNNQDRLSRTIQFMSNEIKSRINDNGPGIDLGNLQDSANYRR